MPLNLFLVQSDYSIQTHLVLRITGNRTPFHTTGINDGWQSQLRTMPSGLKNTQAAVFLAQLDHAGSAGLVEEGRIDGLEALVFKEINVSPVIARIVVGSNIHQNILRQVVGSLRRTLPGQIIHGRVEHI